MVVGGGLVGEGGGRASYVWQNFLSLSLSPTRLCDTRYLDSVLHLPGSPLTALHCQTKKLIPPVTVF